MFLDYFALFMLFFVAIVLFYGVIVIHDIPYEIAEKRNHPHQDAIHVAGWVSLFTLHVLGPFLWIWATLWRQDRGWGFAQIQEEQHDMHHMLSVLSGQVRVLENEIQELKSGAVIKMDDSGQQVEPEEGSPLDSQEKGQEGGVEKSTVEDEILAEFPVS